MVSTRSAHHDASPAEVAASWGIVGHDWAVGLLARSLEAGTIAHAYLISGPRGVGKRTLARTLAQALNCLEPPRCGRCR